MRISAKETSIVAIAAFVSFALSRVIWPDAPGGEPLPSGLLPFFILLGAVSSVAFGLGIAVLVSGLPTFRRLTGLPVGLRDATWLSVVWILASWWPHENLHRVSGEHDFVGLLRIEYGFHVTLIAAACVIAYAFVRLARASAPAQPPRS